MFLSPPPLAPAQAQQLAALFTDVRYRSRRSDPAMWDELLLRGQSFLSAPQLAELRAMGINARRENAMSELEKLVVREKK
jgi:hypothetical protein